MKDVRPMNEGGGYALTEKLPKATEGWDDCSSMDGMVALVRDWV